MVIKSTVCIDNVYTEDYRFVFAFREKGLLPFHHILKVPSALMHGGLHDSAGTVYFDLVYSSPSGTYMYIALH